MRVIRTTIAAALFAASAAAVAVAQTPAAGRPAASAPARPAPATSSAAPQGGATIAEGKFAIIDTESFADPKQGIQRLVAAANVMDREFKPRRDEIQGLKTRYDNIVKQANDTKSVADPKALAALADQADSLKSDIERKQQDGQKAFEKRWRELSEPIYTDINNALLAYARARGVSVVFDISKLAGVMILVNERDAINITDAFIAEYNQRNPASTASTSSPGNQ